MQQPGTQLSPSSVCPPKPPPPHLRHGPHVQLGQVEAGAQGAGTRGGGHHRHAAQLRRVVRDGRRTVGVNKRWGEPAKLGAAYTACLRPNSSPQPPQPHLQRRVELGRQALLPHAARARRSQLRLQHRQLRAVLALLQDHLQETEQQDEIRNAMQLGRCSGCNQAGQARCFVLQQTIAALPPPVSLAQARLSPSPLQVPTQAPTAAHVVGVHGRQPARQRALDQRPKPGHACAVRVAGRVCSESALLWAVHTRTPPHRGNPTNAHRTSRPGRCAPQPTWRAGGGNSVHVEGARDAQRHSRHAAVDHRPRLVHACGGRGGGTGQV